MGAAKIRKKNGTYPFFITPIELKLPDVPEHARESIRKFLSPFLPNIPLKNGDCWNIAQKLMVLANNPRVGYAEGVWTNVVHHEEHRRGACDCEHYDSSRNMFGAPHAWNTVDGHLVDLSVEFKLSGDWCDDWHLWADWQHEQLNHYTPAEFTNFTEWADLDGHALTPIICYFGSPDDFGLTFTDEDRKRFEASDFDEDIIFKSSSDRMEARHKQDEAKAA